MSGQNLEQSSFLKIHCIVKFKTEENRELYILCFTIQLIYLFNGLIVYIQICSWFLTTSQQLDVFQSQKQLFKKHK